MATDIYPVWRYGEPSASTHKRSVRGAYPISDDTLAHRSANGDTSAFAELYERYHARVYTLALRMTLSTAEAEDLTQEVFVRAFRTLGEFRGDPSFAAWLSRLTVGQILAHFRRRGVFVERIIAEFETLGQEQEEKGAAVTATTLGPLRAVDRTSLDRAIAQLPVAYRIILVLHDVEGYEHAEIAGMLGVSTGAIKSQLHRARLRLRKLLKSFTLP